MNTAILEAFFERLNVFAYSPLPEILWPAIASEPPTSGLWLEAKFFPNESEDVVWGSDGCYNARGFFQIMVGYRQGQGQLAPSLLADAVIEHFAKGTNLGPVRVSKPPWQSPAVENDGAQLYIPVTIPYSGLVS